MSVDISLSNWEMIWVAMAGVMRQAEDACKGRKPKWGAEIMPLWQTHIEGALCEYVVAKHLGLFWNGKGIVRGPDVGDDIQVRGAESHDRRLILHPEDDNEKVFYHVTGVYGRYRIHGWLKAKDGKRKEWWQDPSKKNRFAFFVPISELNAINDGLERKAG